MLSCDLRAARFAAPPGRVFVLLDSFGARPELMPACEYVQAEEAQL